MPRAARWLNRRLVLSRLLGLAIFAAALVSEHPFPHDAIAGWLLETFGYLALLVGSFGRAWSALFVAGHKNARVVREGPYAMVRHPLYLSSMLAFLGTALLLGSVVLTLGVTFAGTHAPAMRAEEREMSKRFGTEYFAYVSAVPKFVPAPARLSVPRTLVVAPKIVTRMLFEALLVMLVVPLTEGIQLLHQLHLVPVLIHLW